MGETTSDFLANGPGPVIAVAIGLFGLIGALILQFRTHRYVPWVYWLAVVMVSIFGTMAADGLHVVLGIPYIASTIFYIIVLAAIFGVWYKTERTLSIHSISTKRREYFYWATVLATFALGTATGDLTATTFHLGYLTSGILFAVAFAIPALAYWKLNLHPVIAFWTAYIFTRPFGASFADWMGVSHSRSGLGWGTGPVSLALAVIIIAFVAYLTRTHEDEITEPT